MPAAFRYDNVYGERFAEVLRLQAIKNGDDSTAKFIETATKLYTEIQRAKGKNAATRQFAKKGILGPEGRPFNDYIKDPHKAVKPSKKALDAYSIKGSSNMIEAFKDLKRKIELEQPSRKRSKQEEEFDKSVVEYALSIVDGKNVNATENGFTITSLARFISKKLGIEVFKPKNISKLAQAIKAEETENTKKEKVKKTKTESSEVTSKSKTANKPKKKKLSEDIKEALDECKEAHPEAQVKITKDGKFKVSIPTAGRFGVTMTLWDEASVVHQLTQFARGF